MAKFAKGQRVKCVVADSYVGRYVFPGDVLPVKWCGEGDFFETAGGGIWHTCNFEPVIEASSAPMQNADPLVRPCTCPVGSGCATQTACDGNHPTPGGIIEYTGSHPPVLKATYPDGNPKTSFGRAKPSTRFIPPVAILELGAVMAAGAAKYGPMNWRAPGADVALSVYLEAADRHLLALRDGQDYDPETLREHAAHVMGCMSIIIDAKSLGKLIDDRPLPGSAAKYLVENTKVAA